MTVNLHLAIQVDPESLWNPIPVWLLELLFRKGVFAFVFQDRVSLCSPAVLELTL